MKKLINKANDEPNNAINAGININIPKQTWIGLGLAIGIPAVLIIAMLIIKDTINK